MDKNKKIFLGLVASFLLFLGYYSILSNSGIAVRDNLDERLTRLRSEIERLETENKSLESRQRLLRDENKALAMEARKFYLLSEKAKVLKFKEPAGTSHDGLLSSGISSVLVDKSKNKNKIKEPLPTLTVYRVFYMLISAFGLAALFTKIYKTAS